MSRKLVNEELCVDDDKICVAANTCNMMINIKTNAIIFLLQLMQCLENW